MENEINLGEMSVSKYTNKFWTIAPNLDLWFLEFSHTYWGMSQQAFSVKDQRVNILGFAGKIVSVATTQFCHYSAKADTNNM